MCLHFFFLLLLHSCGFATPCLVMCISLDCLLLLASSSFSRGCESFEALAIDFITRAATLKISFFLWGFSRIIHSPDIQRSRVAERRMQDGNSGGDISQPLSIFYFFLIFLQLLQNHLVALKSKKPSQGRCFRKTLVTVRPCEHSKS